MVTTLWCRAEFSGSPAVDSFPGLGLDFMTAAIVLICSPTTQSPASYTSHRPPTLLLNAHNYLPTALQPYFTCCILPGIAKVIIWIQRQRQSGEQNISCVQSEQCTKSDQNLLLCAGRSRRRQGRMQAFLRHQYTSTPVHHAIHQYTIGYVSEKRVRWCNFDSG